MIQPALRYSIGQVGKVTLDEARKQATKLLGQVALGKDPAEERRMMLKSKTVAQLADLYMKKHCRSGALRLLAAWGRQRKTPLSF